MYGRRTALLGTLVLFCAVNAGAAGAWEYDVWSQDPPQIEAKEPKRTSTMYKPIEKASKSWKICASLPNMADPYWVGSDYGLVDEAKKLGVKIEIIDAGGYTQLARQVSQVEDCASRGADAVILAGISLTGLDKTIEALAGRNIPVIDLQNGLASSKTKAHAVALYFPIMKTLGEYLVKTTPGGGTILLLPGPAGASWSEDSAQGVIAGIAGSSLKIVDTKYGPTDKANQLKLVEDGLQAHPDVTYLVGNAVAIEAAAQVVRERGLKNVKLVATYQTSGVIDLLKAGRVSAVAVDSNVVEARIALDQAVRILDKKDFAPMIVMKGVVVDDKNLKTWEPTSSLAPSGFRPVFKVE